MGCRPVAVVIMHVHKYEIRITQYKYQQDAACNRIYYSKVY